MRPARSNHCTECGQPWGDKTAPFPRTCTSCMATTWKNLLPVGVLIIPLRNQPEHYIVVRRAPQVTVLGGELALVGGFMEAPKARITNPDEANLVWKYEVVREALEEVGLVIDPASLALVDVASATTQPGNLIIFASCPPQDLPTDFIPNDEISNVVALHISEVHLLPWSTHQNALLLFHRRRSGEPNPA